jgi:hypothetical protein
MIIYLSKIKNYVISFEDQDTIEPEDFQAVKEAVS